MHQPNQGSALILNGIDAGNPLGFLAALGAAILATSFCGDTRFFWCLEGGAWRPALQGCGTDKAWFIEKLLDAMRLAGMKPFEIDNKLPFPVGLFETKLRETQRTASPTSRRMADFLVAFGSEINPEKGVFQHSRFRMVRSGDSAGQGLPSYARAIRDLTNHLILERTLFMRWDYQDSGFSLRWDPIEDQRYALRWRDPSKSNLKDGPGTMTGANSLAIESLQWYPTMFLGNRLVTTGFHRNSNKEVWFSWPIWDHPVSLDAVRSLLAFSELHSTRPPRERLAKRGIVEVYRSQRIQPSQYYSNFTMGRPA
jgi:hypothetical protein